MSNERLKQRFVAGESQILLGSAAFWEGVDVAEIPELILVLTRIPFENPKQPFVQKMNRTLRQQGRNAFYEYALPMAMLKIRQALGRGTRTKDQASAVVFLDNRMLRKCYGKQMIQMLETERKVVTLSFDQIRQHIPEVLKHPPKES